MATSLHGAGLAHARALIAAGTINQTSDWSFTGEDSNALLGDPPEWDAYGKWFLGVDSAENPQTKAHYKYPFGKGGTLYRSAMRAIASRAAQNSEQAISNAASSCLGMIDNPPKAPKAVRGPARRAYSVLKIKAVNEDQRVIEGTASTPSTDRQGDVVEPDGAQFKLPIPFLWQHCSDEPVGWVTFAKVTTAGIDIRAQLANVLEAGTLKDRLDEAWQSIKAGLVRGLSIGFMPIEESDISGTWGTRFMKWEWLELSAVTIPANADASIHTIKSYDTDGTAAPGRDRVVHPSGAPDARRATPARKDTHSMKTTAEKITAFKAEKDAKVARLNELAATSEDGSTMDAAQQEEFDTLEAEIKSIDAHLARLDRLEQLNKGQARPVKGATPDEGSASRGETIVRVSDRTEKGQRFARVAMCLAAAKGNPMAAINNAEKYYNADPAVVGIVKAAVTGGTTADGGGPIVQYQDIITEFIEFLRPGSIIGKFGANGIPGLHRIGFNTRTVSQTGAGSAYWVGQGKPTPLTKATFSTVLVDFTKVATIAVLTKEEVRFSSPSAELRVRDELARAINARLDQDFIDPTNAGTANVKPASVLNGVAAVSATGTAAANVQADVAALMAKFAAANLDPVGPVFIMSKTTAINLSLMLTSLGQPQYPSLTMNGGNLFGIPVIVSEYLQSLGSPGTGMVALVDANEVYLADDGNVTVEASDQASLEMLDGSLVQDGTTGTGTSLVSLWQSDLLGLKAQREIAWKLRRAGVGAYYISNAAYAA